MDISGSQKIKAPREQVFNALQNAEILKKSIPGCESAEYVDAWGKRQLKIVITTGVPGFKGPYEIYLQARDVNAPAHLVLHAEPTSSVGSIKAVCTVDLSDDPAGTKLNYNANAEMSGKIASVPDIVAKPAVKGSLDKFFSNFEKQVSVG
jgi:carbon monoxide dehydrogenase subunit G